MEPWFKPRQSDLIPEVALLMVICTEISKTVCNSACVRTLRIERKMAILNSVSVASKKERLLKTGGGGRLLEEGRSRIAKH